MTLLPTVKHERNLVVAHACRKTTITLRPYGPLASSLDYFIVGASLSEPHSNVENVRWSMREEPRRKTALQHTTVVWYGGSCTNKHDKLTDTPIQVLCIAKISVFMS